MLDYLKQRNIPTTASATKIYSRDRNLWHISHEGGAIEDPVERPARGRVDAHRRSRQGAPTRPRTSRSRSSTGRPVSLNGSKMPAWQIIEKLNASPARTASAASTSSRTGASA
jgi:argininosuccinate synthase